MPELAEVEFFRKQWNPGLGKRIVSVDCHAEKRIFRDMAVEEMRGVLRGSFLKESRARGKQMLFCFDAPAWLGVHLGMTGRLSTGGAGVEAGKHDHLILRSRDVSLIFTDPRLFGRIRFDTGNEPPDWWRELPPECTGPLFTTRHLTGIIQRRGGTPLKALLLDQAHFPGIGNWMADEICWRERLFPGIRAGTLNDAQIRSLRNTIRRVCRQALEVIGTGWNTPPRTWLFQHRWREGGTCPRCRTDLQRAPIGGRTTCWCPQCQGSRRTGVSPEVFFLKNCGRDAHSP